MPNSWREVEQAHGDKRCELIISGPVYAKRIEEEGLDKNIFKLVHLNFLEISKTPLNALPPDIGVLSNLTRIMIFGNQLQELPSEICELKKLKFIDVSRNAISELPNDIGTLPELQSLNVSFNQLSTVPSLNGTLKLVTLNIANNKFQQLPLGVCDKNLIHFTDLIANNNSITEIPPEIEWLGGLKVLDLGENEITSIPGELGNCTKLKELNLKGNNLKDKRLLKLVERCHVKQVMDYVRSHCPLDHEFASHDAKQGKTKKKGKRNRTTSESEEIQQLLDEIKILHVGDETKQIFSSPRVAEIRPYIVSCIVQDVNLENGVLKKFITLQTKLHDNICEKRTVATIATHDLSKIQGNLLYDARPPQEIKIIPLNRKKEQTAAELYNHLNAEADALRKEKKKNSYSGIHKYLYLLKDKPLYPCLLDSRGEVISFPPITNSDTTKISEETKHIFLEVTGNNLAACKKVMDQLVMEMLKLGIGNKDSCADEDAGPSNNLILEQVKVVDEEGQLKVVYPSRTDIQANGITVTRT